MVNPDKRDSPATMTVEIDGIPWSRVQDFADSGPEDRHFMAAVDPSTGAASIRFGDGARGARPPTGEANVTATYRVGAGSQPAEGDDPLARLLEGIKEEVDLLEAELEQLCVDQFIETAGGWATPYPIDGLESWRWTFSRADGRRCLCLCTVQRSERDSW